MIIKYNFILFIFLLISWSSLSAQNKYYNYGEKLVNEIKVKDSICFSFLDSIEKANIKCFNKTWTILIFKKENKTFFYIELIDGLKESLEPYGYCNINKSVFYFFGENLKNIFEFTKEQKVFKFKEFKKVYNIDYSTWIYEYTSNSINLISDYSYKCD